MGEFYLIDRAEVKKQDESKFNDYFIYYSIKIRITKIRYGLNVSLENVKIPFKEAS